jgi:hypothetical protein
MEKDEKTPKKQEGSSGDRQSVTVYDAQGRGVHAPTDLEERGYRVCEGCSSTFRIPKRERSRVRFCSHACRKRAYAIQKAAEEAYLKEEIAALEAGQDNAEPRSETRRKTKERTRDGIALAGGLDPERSITETRDSRARSLLERVRSAEPFTPEEASRLQSGIADLVEDQVLEAHRVVMGTLSWSPVQARVFNTLLNKCVPDLSASFTKSENTNVNISEMSREELEKIVAAANKTIEAEPLSPADQEEQELD